MARCDVQAQAVRTTSATRWIPRRDRLMRLEIDRDRVIFVFQVRIEPTAFGVHRVAFRVAGKCELGLLHQRGRVENPNALFAGGGHPHLLGWRDIGDTVWPGVKMLTRYTCERARVERTHLRTAAIADIH